MMTRAGIIALLGAALLVSPAIAAETPRPAREAAHDRASLDNVAGLMDDVKQDLDKIETGLDTRAKQNRIIAMLDTLIEQAQDQEQDQSRDQGQDQEGQDQGQGRSRSSGSPKGAGRPDSPADHSVLADGASNDEGKAASTAAMGDFWARLPARQRAEILDTLRQRFPRRYRELIAAYYRSLSSR